MHFMRDAMDTVQKNPRFVRVKDGAGNTFVCPIEALRDPKELSEEEMGECVDEATVGRYAGNIDIVDE
jgi:hypothetical protein